jgi:hypothetical protein
MAHARHEYGTSGACVATSVSRTLLLKCAQQRNRALRQKAEPDRAVYPEQELWQRRPIGLICFREADRERKVRVGSAATQKEHEEFVNQRQAYERFGIAPMTLRRRVRRGEIATYEAPLDRRVQLYRVRDLETLQQPRPLSREVQAASAA